MHRGMPTMGLIGRAGPARTRKGDRGGGTRDRNISTEIVLPIADDLPLLHSQSINMQATAIAYGVRSHWPNFHGFCSFLLSFLQKLGNFPIKVGCRAGRVGHILAPAC
jgi:hypothetical protein